MTYKAYLRSPAWQKLRRAVFDRAVKNANSKNRFGVCEKCGYEPWKPCLQVHHRNYDHVFGEKLEDLILLCPCGHKAEIKSKNVQEANSHTLS